MSKSASQGFVLPFVLSILSIMALLVLAQYQNLLLQRKVLHAQLRQFNTRQQLLLVSKKLLNDRKLRTSACLIPPLNPEAIATLLDTSKACSLSLKGQTFHYRIETFSQSPCVQIQAGHAAARYQFWMQKQGNSMLLRVFYVSMGAQGDCLKGKIRQIPQGVQSWNFSY